MLFNNISDVRTKISHIVQYKMNAFHIHILINIYIHVIVLISFMIALISTWVVSV